MYLRILALASTLLVAPAASMAESAEDKGLAIFQESEKRGNGFDDYASDMEMILKNRQGDESRREIRIFGLEVDGDGDKTLAIFDNPADVKGTAMLTYSYRLSDDDQWLYLPALKRVKRIASRNKSGPYMGSEFAYEDIGSQEVEKYTYKYLRDEALNGQPHFVVERYPVNEYSGYTRQIVWLDQAEYRLQKIDFYDRKNSLLKTLIYRGYNKYLENHWRPDEMYMENHQTGKTTLILWKNYKFRTGLTDNDFRVNNLERAR